MSLYLKYRPVQFASLVGQDHVRITLLNAFKKGQVNHAYLFCGPRGTGKTSTARLIAKSLNCPNLSAKTFEPCNECEICEAISAGSIIDIIEIDAASNRGIDEIRELKETIKFAPTRLENKVYIIDEVHMLTNEAFNALLKTLEEPPSNVYFILATTEVHKIPDTIISRCQRFDFRRLTEKVIETRLAFIAQNEKIEIEPGALDLIAAHVDGGLRDAIGLLEQLSVDGSVSLENTKNLIGSTGLETIEAFLTAVLNGDRQAALNVIEEIYNEGYDLGQFQLDFMKHLRSALHEAMEDGDNSSVGRLVGLISEWQKTIDTFKNSVIPQLGLEVFVVRSCNGNEVLSVKDKSKNDEKVVAKVEKKEIKGESKVEDLEKEKEVKNKDEEKQEKEGLLKEEVADKVVVESDVDLEQAWKEALKKINKPMIRRSFQQGRMRPIGEGVEVAFNSDFHFKTVNSAEHIAMIEKLLADIGGGAHKVNLVKEDFEMAPSVEVEESPAIEAFGEGDDFSGMDEPDELVSATDHAADLFEGEWS